MFSISGHGGVCDSCVRSSRFPNLLVSNYCIVMKNCRVSAKNVTRVNVTVRSITYTDGKQGLPAILWPHPRDVPPLHHYCLFPISVNSEVSNEVEVTPGVLIRALRAAPVGPCYTNYLKWFQLLIRWSYKIIG